MGPKVRLFDVISIIDIAPHAQMVQKITKHRIREIIIDARLSCDSHEPLAGNPRMTSFGGYESADNLYLVRLTVGEGVKRENEAADCPGMGYGECLVLWRCSVEDLSMPLVGPLQFCTTWPNLIPRSLTNS